MTSKSPESARLAELEAMLETYGSDRTRWPAPVRHQWSGFISGNAEAQQLLEDARALDALLDMAPAPSAAEIARFTDRVVAVAEKQPRMVVSRPVPQVKRRMFRDTGIAAAALAASLVLGVLAGQSQYIDPSQSLVADTQTQTSESNGDQLAQMDETYGLLGEDLL